MIQTENDLGPVDADANLDTLAAEDLLADANLDDRLLRRDLKSKIFGSSTTVQIGRYEVLRRIGRGGMGTVYVAHDPELDRKVALKVLRPDRRSGRDRMLHEARALARLAHPNVVTVHEVGVHDERVFVAMELVEGRTLRQWVEGSPEREELYDVFLQAARGLSAAHRAGLVHRDFKPDNVLIGDDARVRVVDFGVVKATDMLDADDLAEGRDRPTSEALPELTLTGQLLGTPAYMAAEQFRGAEVDARTDVFAFCVSLYEALTGSRPFAGDNAADVCRSVLAATFAPLPAGLVPPALATVIERGLSRDPDERPASMEGLVSALEGVVRPAVAAPPARRRRAGLWVASAGLLVAGSTVMLGGPGQPTEPTPAAAVAAAPEHDPADAEQQRLEAAFAAIAAAPDDSQRLDAAERFLEEHGTIADPARRAVAHSTIGDIHWRASCSATWMNLCVEQLDSVSSAVRCNAPVLKPLVRRERDAERREIAIEHLDAALSLEGVEHPEDPRLRSLFGEAIGRARVQRLDDKLEEYIGIDAPTDLDFVDDPKAENLSKQAFTQYYEQVNRLRGELMSGYAAVKGSENPQWVIVAAARSGLTMADSAQAMDDIPVPESFADAQRPAYCQALGEWTRPFYAGARGAYTYCVDKGVEYGSEQPDVAWCREQLESLAALQP